jgi:single-stranded DNA-binding protein
MLFTFVIEGNLIAAPSRSTSPNGTPFTSLKMVHNNRYKNQQGQWVDGKKLFLEVICYRELGTRAAKLNKGDTVIVEAADLRAFESGGFVNQYITARNVSVSMRWHDAASLRQPKPASQPPQEAAPADADEEAMAEYREELEMSAA